MSLSGLILQYGYLAVFVGALLEGESVLLLAGFAAHQGWLHFAWVAAVAALGGTLGDQGYYWLGRRYGDAVLRRFPGLSGRVERVRGLLQRHHAPLIVGVRFMYGLRVAGPLAMGASGVPAWRFALFNALGAAIWAPLVAGAGYLFGQTLEWLFDDIRRYQEAALAALLVLALLGALLHRVWRRRFRPRA